MPNPPFDFPTGYYFISDTIDEIVNPIVKVSQLPAQQLIRLEMMTSVEDSKAYTMVDGNVVKSAVNASQAITRDIVDWILTYYTLPLGFTNIESSLPAEADTTTVADAQPISR